uniref:SRCR domain-containing protein n=1 Tax=Oncorhynchus tshawytscha TaxID=74940 RepID=A0A8C8IW33_ONCTS
RLVNGTTSCSGTVEVFYRGEWSGLCPRWWKSVRLVDGAGLCSGRVEVKSNQSWASVCEADFDRQDAEVVCRDVGCGAPAALQGGLYGEGEGQTWDKEFQCKGKESLLLDCDTSDRENNTCLPGNAVGLTCSEPDDVRLVGGGSRCAGGVEWYDQGEWRTCVDRLLPGNTTDRGFQQFSYCSGSESSLRDHVKIILCCKKSSFLLTFTGSNRTQTQPAVNHSAAFLFPAADDSHQGNYSCVYDNYVFSHNFSSESELLSLTITGN